MERAKVLRLEVEVLDLESWVVLILAGSYYPGRISAMLARIRWRR